MQINKHGDKRKADKRANKDRYENGDGKKKTSERERSKKKKQEYIMAKLE